MIRWGAPVFNLGFGVLCLAVSDSSWTNGLVVGFALGSGIAMLLANFLLEQMRGW